MKRVWSRGFIVFTVVMVILWIASIMYSFADQDTAWQAASIAYAGSIFADLRTTDLLQDRCSFCKESSPLLSDRPNDAELYLWGGLISYGIWKACDYLRYRGYRRTAIAILWVYTAFHFEAALGNHRSRR